MPWITSSPARLLAERSDRAAAAVGRTEQAGLRPGTESLARGNAHVVHRQVCAEIVAMVEAGAVAGATSDVE